MGLPREADPRQVKAKVPRAGSAVSPGPRRRQDGRRALVRADQSGLPHAVRSGQARRLRRQPVQADAATSRRSGQWQPAVSRSVRAAVVLQPRPRPPGRKSTSPKCWDARTPHTWEATGLPRTSCRWKCCAPIPTTRKRTRCSAMSTPTRAAVPTRSTSTAPRSAPVTRGFRCKPRSSEWKDRVGARKPRRQPRSRLGPARACHHPRDLRVKPTQKKRLPRPIHPQDNSASGLSATFP